MLQSSLETSWIAKGGAPARGEEVAAGVLLHGRACAQGSVGRLRARAASARSVVDNLKLNLINMHQQHV